MDDHKLTKYDIQLLCQIVDDGIKECARKIYENPGKWDGETQIVDGQIAKIKHLQSLTYKLDMYGEENFKDWHNLDDWEDYEWDD